MLKGAVEHRVFSRDAEFGSELGDRRLRYHGRFATCSMNGIA